MKGIWSYVNYALGWRRQISNSALPGKRSLQQYVCGVSVDLAHIFCTHVRNRISICAVNHLRHRFSFTTRMWANAQRDGRPAEHRWHPLFNAAKFGWCPLLECRAVTQPRCETSWNLQGCPKLTKRSQPIERPKFTILRGHVEEILLLNRFFPIVDTCRSCEDKADKVVGWCPDGDFWRFFGSCICSEPRAAPFRPAF